MPHYSRKMPSGRHATLVEVMILENGGGPLATKRITILSDGPCNRLEAETEAMTIAAADVSDEGEWGVVMGASALPVDETRGGARVTA